MAAEGDHIRRYNYTGEDRRVPDDVTHVTVDQSVTVIPEDAFSYNDNIVEVVCDLNVKKVERRAFDWCPSLRRLIMPGVEVIDEAAFSFCEALTDVECGKLEIIENLAFQHCNSLSSINLQSAKIVEYCAFRYCEALAVVKFGSKLERIEGEAFYRCTALERITIPLKDGLITHDGIFIGCDNLRHIDLVEGELHETIVALQLKEWRNDMNEEINSINQILPDEPEVARAIRTWIRSVLRKIIHYQAEHRRLFDEEVATTFQLALPQDIVMKNVVSFLELPSYTFEV